MGSPLLAVLMLFIQEIQGVKDCSKEEHNVTVKWGDTAHLPCSFSPPKALTKQGVRVSWQKEHSDMDLVVHFQNGKEEGDQQNERFRGRTLVGVGWFQDGDAKLILRGVTGEDSGKYTCWITLLPLRTWTQYKCSEVILTISEDTRIQKEKGDQVSVDRVIAWSLVVLIILLFACLPCLVTGWLNPGTSTGKNANL